MPRRVIYLWHRYLGIALCVLFIIWFVTGVVMLYVRMPILFPAERFRYLAEFEPQAVAVTPFSAVEKAGLKTPPRRIRLAAFQNRPIYYLLPRGNRWVGVFADTGELLPSITPDLARQIVHTSIGESASVRFVGTVDTIDQWTLTNSLNLHRPLHRVSVDDRRGTEFYVSAVTGEIVMRTSRRERALAWIGPILHWGAPEFLRTRVALWRQSMLWTSGAGILLVVSGLWIGVVRYRYRGYSLRTGPSKSPYTGWKRWHHWGGLVFGAVTFTWMVSGWLYLNPGGGRSGPLETITTMSPYNVGGVRADNSSVPEHSLALSGGPLDPALFTVSVARAWKPIAGGRPREVELTRVGGRPFFVFYADWDRSWIVPGDGGAPAAPAAPAARTRFDADHLVDLASHMIPNARLTEARLVNQYDAYYYSVGAVAPKRLPVLLVKFDDPSRTWYYIDLHTGSIFRRYDQYGRVMRWLVNGLHSLDLPLLFAHRPAWDMTVITLSAGGLALSFTGLVLGWRRIRPVPAKRVGYDTAAADPGFNADVARRVQ